MRWIQDKAEFEKILIDARMCVYIDSRRAPTPLQVLLFGDITVCTPDFLPLLQNLMEWSSDSAAYFVVLDPDPIDNFYRLYEKYPVLEIARNDSTQAYLGGLNEDVGDGRGFALSDLWATYVILPPSKKWFIHTIRSAYDDSGHLWIPPEWADRVLAAHPFVFRDAPASLGEQGAGTPRQKGPAVP
ncbi:MAG TPA: hypothetical protein VFL79_13845 [Terriglobia bacterium]|nr:hypothetical protein [Terriglobia bacterium]